jgi:hypothetical protein
MNAQTIIADDDGPPTFVCSECGELLPLSHQHQERPGVCFLDYVSERDRAEIRAAIAEYDR